MSTTSPITFTQLFTGKHFTVTDRKSVLAIIHGTASEKNNSPEIAAVFIIVENLPPVAVKETEEEVMALLGLNNQEKKQ